MAQFDSELDANQARAKFDALSRSPIGATVTTNLLKLLQILIRPEPAGGTELLDAGIDAVASLREESELRQTEELGYLVRSVALTVQRHERGIDGLRERMDLVEQRLEDGIKAAIRYPSDGRLETIDRIAIVVVRSAIDFTAKPQEQTTEFLRIASQITDSEMAFLRIMFETQGRLSPPGPLQSREEWLQRVQRHWGQMNAASPASGEDWMYRKSICVRLQGYGFLEQVERSPTAERSETGQAPYALLPLGKEFCEYTRPI